MISMDKKYKTRSGIPVRILCVDAEGNFPVVALYKNYVLRFNEDGRFDESLTELDYDLIEVSPYDAFKIDDPVMVRRGPSQSWSKRYFAGVDSEGSPTTWANGATSWSRDSHTSFSWSECRKPTEAELWKNG